MLWLISQVHVKTYVKNCLVLIFMFVFSEKRYFAAKVLYIK